MRKQWFPGEYPVRRLFRPPPGLFLLLLAALLLAGCGPRLETAPELSPAPSPLAAGELAAVLDSQVLVIAADPAAAPHSEWLKDQPRAAGTRCNPTQYTASQFAGFDIDVAKEIARRLGVEPCFVTPTWGQITTGSWGGLWDIVVQSMVITPERMDKLYFTQPYIHGEMFAFVHADNRAVRQPSDLAGKKIGVCAGCANEMYLRGALQIPGETIEVQIQDPQIIGYDTDTSALLDLALGDGARLDGVISDADTAAVLIGAGEPIKQLPGVLYRDFSAVAVDKNSASDPVPLVMRLSEIIRQMHQDGTLLALSEKYYRGDFTTLAAQYDLSALEQFP